MQQLHTPTIVTLGLAGGQGKSTVALMLGRYLGRLGIPVLFVVGILQAIIRGD